MATIVYRVSGGVTVWFAQDEDREQRDRQRHPRPLHVSLADFEFDEDANPTIVQEVLAQPGRFTVIGGALLRDGIPLAVPDGPRRRELSLLRQALTALAGVAHLTGPQLATIPAAITALNAGTATTAQTQLLLRGSLLLLRGIVRRLMPDP